MNGGAGQGRRVGPRGKSECPGRTPRRNDRPERWLLKTHGNAMGHPPERATPSWGALKGLTVYSGPNPWRGHGLRVACPFGAKRLRLKWKGGMTLPVRGVAAVKSCGKCGCRSRAGAGKTGIFRAPFLTAGRLRHPRCNHFLLATGLGCSQVIVPRQWEQACLRWPVRSQCITADSQSGQTIAFSRV
jgi:hypothetical protein